MGLINEAEIQKLASGCPHCGETTLVLDTFVDGRLRVMLGEAAGGYRWLFDGEKFLDGIYRARCAGCEETLFASELCPRCHEEEGLSTALEEESVLEVPDRCPECDEMEVLVVAFVPVSATYSGQRGTRPSEYHAEIEDPGFHVVSVDCEICGFHEDHGEGCPLCGAAGPLRPRP